jgi:hypothetical protein
MAEKKVKPAAPPPEPPQQPLSAEQRLAIALAALAATQQALDYCGGGDRYERECNAPLMRFADAACVRIGLIPSNYDFSDQALPGLYAMLA